MAAKKKLEGVELANDIMLKEIAAFLVSKKFYGKEIAKEEQEKKAAIDISKRGKLYKFLEKEGIKTKFDLAVTHRDGCLENFDIYAKVMKQYRAQVVKKSFGHRLEDCK